jgi:hypothetical protein
MLLPKGSIVDIDGIQGALAEDVTISLKSNFRPLASDFQNEVTQMIDVAGATTRSLSGGRAGFSSQVKQMTTQVWDKTDPARFRAYPGIRPGWTGITFRQTITAQANSTRAR